MNDEKDKSSVVSKASLLGLPRELRDKIYRNLHLNAKTLYYSSAGSRVANSDDKFEWDELVGCNLSSGLFRVCRQMYEEGSAILWGENLFAFKVYEKHGREQAPFWKADHIECSRNGGVPIQKIRKFRIMVEFQSDEEFWIIRSSVRKVCQVLSDIPVLQQLDISLEFEQPDIQISPRVLEPFALLRHVSSVTISGVPPQLGVAYVNNMFIA